MFPSSTNLQLPPSSATVQPNESQAWLQQTQKFQSAAQLKATEGIIRASGDIRIRTIILIFISLLSLILVIFGGFSFFLIPDQSKDIWTIISPIITASITGTIAFLTGEKSGS